MAARLAVITGASAGIGAAFAKAYAARGCDVALVARRRDRLEALARDIKAAHGVDALAIEADLAAPDGVDRVIAGLAGRTADILVNNAGHGLNERFAETPWESHEAYLRLMTTSYAHLAHALIGGMRGKGYGRIINVASVAGLLPGTGDHAFYAATKAFLVKFSQSLHAQSAAEGVHVSALCPGFTYSEFHDVTGTRPAMKTRVPSWMWCTAEEVVAAGVAGVDAGDTVVVPGSAYKALTALARFLPDQAVQRAARRTRTFRDATQG